MLAFAAILAAAAFVPGSTAGMINSVSGLTTCQPSLISWQASTSPYYITVIPGGQPDGATLKNLGTFTTELSYTWNVDLAAGTDITIQLKDGTGALFYTGQTTIVAGSDTSCVNSSVDESGAASGSAAAATASADNTASTAAAGASSAATSAAGAATSAAGAATSAAGGAATSAKAGASSVAAGGASKASSAAAAASSVVSSNTGAGYAKAGLSSLAAVGAIAIGAIALA